jgi:uncharacterized membrane protein YgaE (UPF0421/DUF939 family)
MLHGTQPHAQTCAELALPPTSRPTRTLAALGDDLLDEAARRSRGTFRARAEGLRVNALPVAQTAVAASLAWLVARELIGHPRPFFAAVAATISLGVTLGQRSRRTIEMVVGVSLGVLIGDVLVALIGQGTWQIALFVALAMSAAILVGGGPLLIGQAAASAVLVATLPTAGGGGVDLSRAIDALVGGAIGVLVSLLLPIDPVGRASRAAAPVLAELSAVLEDVAAALAGRDVAAAEAALTRARSLDAPTAVFHDAVEVGAEIARMAPPRRATRAQLALYAGAAGQLDLAVRNVRVLARGAVRALLLDDHVPPELGDALRDLAAAVRGLGRELEGEDTVAEAREAARLAAGRATLVLERTGNLSVSVLVGQVRSTAVDLLRGTGLDADTARRAVVDAARALEDDAPRDPDAPPGDR